MKIPLNPDQENNKAEENYSSVDDICKIMETLEFIGQAVNLMEPETEEHYVTNIDALAEFTKQKSKALKGIANTLHGLSGMAKTIVVDEELEQCCCECCYSDTEHIDTGKRVKEEDTTTIRA